MVRVATVLVSVPLVLILTYFGGAPFFLMVLVIALASLNEFYNLMARKGSEPYRVIGIAVTIFFISFAQYTLKHPNWEPAQAAIFTFGLVIAFSAAIFLRRAERTVSDIAITTLGVVYVGWLFSYFVLIRALSIHGNFLFFMLLVVWINDTAAFVIGKFFGRIKMAPLISPNKTWEGAIGGFVIAVSTAILVSPYMVGLYGLNPFHAGVLAIIVAITAQIGDLVESLIKRDVGAKNSGDWIPGHGGMLDRMDSFILSAPFVYYYLVWILGRT